MDDTSTLIGFNLVQNLFRSVDVLGYCLPWSEDHNLKRRRHESQNVRYFIRGLQCGWRAVRVLCRTDRSEIFPGVRLSAGIYTTGPKRRRCSSTAADARGPSRKAISDQRYGGKNGRTHSKRKRHAEWTR